METVADLLAAIPRVPDLDLPTPADPDLLIVVATFVTMLGLLGLASGWVEQRLSKISLTSTLFGAALFFWVWETDRDGFGWIALPEAFIEIIARLVR